MAGFWLPVEDVFNLLVETSFWVPVEVDGIALACFAEGALSFLFAEATLGVCLLAWTSSILSTLLCRLFSMGVGVILPTPVLAAWPFSCGPCYFFGVFPGVSFPLAFFST